MKCMSVESADWNTMENEKHEGACVNCRFPTSSHVPKHFNTRLQNEHLACVSHRHLLGTYDKQKWISGKRGNTFKLRSILFL